MNFLKKKVVLIPIVIILLIILISYLPKVAGVVIIIGTIASGIHLYTKNPKFKEFNKGIKALITIALIFIFFIGVGGLVYNPETAKQQRIASEKAKTEKQQKEEAEKAKKNEEVQKSEEAKKISETKKTEETKQESVQVAQVKQPVDITNEIKSKINGTYLKSSTSDGEKITAQYEYSKNIEKDVQYFETGDKINKVLMEDPLRIIRKYKEVKQVLISVKNEEKTFYVDISKDELEKFLGFKIEEIKSDEDWGNKVVSKYFNKNERQRFVNKYVKNKSSK